MDILLIAVTVICVLTLIGLCYCIYKIRKLNIEKGGLDGELLHGAVEEIKDSFREEERKNADMLYNRIQQNGLNVFAESINRNIMNITQLERSNFENIERRVDELVKTVESKIEKLGKEVSLNLTEVRSDNEKQLEKMRLTVDEKLSETLESRLNRSFSLIGERIDAVQKGFGEIQSLASSVADIKKVFSNVKTRGVWGEVALENLLKQVLVGEQFVKFPQVEGKEQVDFALILPGKDNGKILLPIDSKFPLEDYQRLVDASEKGDGFACEVASKNLERRIKEEAKKIKEKYIAPPKTTDFGVLYLPVEGLYAEIAKRSGLLEEIQSKYRIMICGPTTLGAFLNSLQMGFKTLAIEKRSSEIWQLLGIFKREFYKFADLLSRTQTKAEEVTETIKKASDRTNMIQKKLSKVEYIEEGKDDDIKLIDSGDII